MADCPPGGVFPDRDSARSAFAAFADGVRDLAVRLGIRNHLAGAAIEVAGSRPGLTVKFIGHEAAGNVLAWGHILDGLSTSVERAAEDLGRGVVASESRMATGGDAEVALHVAAPETKTQIRRVDYVPADRVAEFLRLADAMIERTALLNDVEEMEAYREARGRLRELLSTDTVE